MQRPRRRWWCWQARSTARDRRGTGPVSYTHLGCAALTGVEAISNGVPAFREPKSHNAATTLALLGGIAVTMLSGIIILANLTGLKLVDPDGQSFFTDNGVRVPESHDTAMGQLARTIFDTFQPGFYFVITMTMVILFLAANTAFNGFPVLGSILARDGFLPRALHTRGDRLDVYKRQDHDRVGGAAHDQLGGAQPGGVGARTVWVPSLCGRGDLADGRLGNHAAGRPRARPLR